MSKSPFGFGIVGPGMIAGVVADALAESNIAKLVAVSSRRLENAQKFVASRPGVAAVEGYEALLSRPDVQEVYVATPTVFKEAIALAAIAAGKHVLVDKPFANHASVLRMAEAAKAAALLFMDATHFVHHPRTLEIKKATAEKIGTPRSLHTAFYFPFSDRTNIRFDPKQEPMTALGDMAWYSMRAVVEYLRPAGKIIKVAAVPERDTVTNAIIRVAGMIAFEDGKISTFDVGYTAGTIVMDLELFGTTGVISMDDFVLDWTESFAFKNPDIQTGYTHRTGMATRKDAVFIPTQNQAPQQRGMVEHFALEAMNGTPKYRAAYAAAALQTQEYVDALWAAATS